MGSIADNHQSTLPPKEQALFKRVVKMYEQKQYKMAVKIAKQILSNAKCADHGETLAMKGLSLHYLGRKDEAYEDIKHGLKHDIKSYICWHVYGVVQKNDRKYEEAQKCFINALKFCKDNLQILRDLSTVQIHLRDLDGFRDTRYRLAVLRPMQISNWLAYAVALHLQGDFSLAIPVMEECRKLAQGDRTPEKYDVEYAEYVLYQIQLYNEAEQYDQAIEHSLRHETYVADYVALLESRVQAFFGAGRVREANDALIQLIERNPENWGYYRQLTFPLDENCPDLLSFCQRIQREHPYSRTALKIPLTLTSGEQFRSLVRDYIWQGLQKGIPSLFNDVKLLYQDDSKASIIEELLLEFEKKLQERANDDVLASTQLWHLHFLAHHHDRKKEYDRALHFIEKALEHTPTFVEAYAFKAKVLKHMGKFEEAAVVMEEAQSLDTSDRFINCKTGKYLLRANQIEKAEAMLGRFTREGLKPSEFLCDMQCFWFMTETARAFHRIGKSGDALRLLHIVNRHFMDIVNDQIDFHSYCLRKSTIRSYVSLLRTEDNIHQHKFYMDAAVLAAQIYLNLHEKPFGSSNDNGGENTGLTEEEIRKAKNKERKAQKKAETEKAQQEALEKTKAQSKAKKDDDEPIATQKEDLIPEKLARPEDPLEEAAKFLRPLISMDINREDFLEVAFEVFFRRGKYALALKYLANLVAVNPRNDRIGEFQSKCLRASESDPALNIEAVVELFQSVRSFSAPGGKPVA